MAQKLRPSELSFETLCNFFDAINIDNMEGWKNKFERRRQNIVLFLETSIDRKSGEAYDVFRLVFPNLDTERGNYKLKETTLGSLFVPAMGWTKNDVRANALLNWKNPGISTGAGDLSAIVEDTLTKLSFVRNDAPLQERKRIKVATINEKLDELVKAAAEVLPEERRKKQLSILTFFVKKTTPRQCKWITQIILKSMKHKCGEGQIFREWHPDAQAYYDSHGMSLRAVFNDLKDPYKPGTTDIVPGKVANPQLAATTVSSQIAIQKLISYEKKRYGPEAAGKSVRDIDLSFVIETKFDGERIQVHRTGNKVKYFSRNAIEHGARSHYTVLDDVILAATGGRVSEEDLKDEKKNGAASKFDCVLDGELIVWNKKL